MAQALDSFWERINAYQSPYPDISGISDPNDRIYLALHKADVLIKNLEAAQSDIEWDIKSIKETQAELKQHLPANYTPPWHQLPGDLELINNVSGYTYKY